MVAVTYPKEAPVCMHFYWGLVTIVGMDIEPLLVGGIDRRLIEVHADELYEMGHPLAAYCTRAWTEHLKPLNHAAVDMLAACVLP